MNYDQNWTASQIQAWRRTRAKGSMHFIFLYGFLLRGSILFLLLLVGVFIVRPIGIYLVAITLSFAGVGYGLGIIVGILHWRRNEKLYKAAELTSTHH